MQEFSGRPGADPGRLGYEEFFADQYRRTVMWLAVVLGSVSEAEDGAQEAFARAATHWPRIAAYQDPGGWVRRVAYHLALNGIRRARLRAATLLHLAPEPALDSLPEDAIDLHRALRRLPVRYRAVLTLHYLVDLPVQQIAAQLDLPVETVRTQLARGRQRLRVELGEARGPRPGPSGPAGSAATWGPMSGVR